MLGTLFQPFLHQPYSPQLSSRSASEANMATLVADSKVQENSKTDRSLQAGMLVGGA